MTLIDRLLNTPQGGKLLSIILGLGLSALFRSQCIGEKCILVRSSQEKIKNTTFKYTKDGETRCARFNPELNDCKFKIDKNLQ
jgi:hypothetical protein